MFRYEVKYNAFGYPHIAFVNADDTWSAELLVRRTYPSASHVSARRFPGNAEIIYVDFKARKRVAL